MSHIVNEHAKGRSLVSVADELATDKVPAAPNYAHEYLGIAHAVLRGRNATVSAEVLA